MLGIVVLALGYFRWVIWFSEEKLFTRWRHQNLTVKKYINLIGQAQMISCVLHRSYLSDNQKWKNAVCKFWHLPSNDVPRWNICNVISLQRWKLAKNAWDGFRRFWYLTWNKIRAKLFSVTLTYFFKIQMLISLKRQELEKKCIERNW